MIRPSTSFIRCTRGGVAAMAAAAVPLLAVLVVGATELTAMNADRSSLQDAADAAALAVAKELQVTPEGATDRAEALALEYASDLAARSELTADTQLGKQDGADAITVSLTSRRPSFFGGLLPPGGFVTQARATALSLRTAPLCVLGHGVSGAVLGLQDQSRIQADGCLVQANDDIAVASSAALQAGGVQAVGSAYGPINPAALEGAEPIADPFAKRTFTVPVGCASTEDVSFEEGDHVLPAGAHCGDVLVSGTATLRLEPGEHFFKSARLQVTGAAKLTGSDVALVFRDADMLFAEQASVSLEGRKAGVWAGFVIVGLSPPTTCTTTLLVLTSCTTADHFLLGSDNVTKLEGVIYVPTTRLTVQGVNPVAAQSDWTVMVAKSVEVRGSPTLFINSRYAVSRVPVPQGVGPGAANTRLIR